MPLVRSLGWEDPLEKEMATHPVFLPGESHGWRSLVGYSPWVAKSQTRLSDFTFTFTSNTDLTWNCLQQGGSLYIEKLGQRVALGLVN